ILNSHLEIESPYNTYKFAGLPPGPITFPEVSSIKAVLNHEEHNYVYMCAREDFSGYHNFASTLSKHNQNAAKYRAALDENRIYK
ncbi:MAG: endolytic transglycosylase MltG, partial [Bacteroidota bacterium]